MPEAGVEHFGPPEGPGAGLRWNDLRYGKGEVLILESSALSSVEYRVSVEDGAIRIRGVVTLSPSGSGTLVLWEEEGDFGRNPLLGYAARGMAKSQSAAMEASLARLGTLLGSESGTTSPP
jgi:hypothetical protein